jgi:hypothetical protein
MGSGGRHRDGDREAGCCFGLWCVAFVGGVVLFAHGCDETLKPWCTEERHRGVLGLPVHVEEYNVTTSKCTQWWQAECVVETVTSTPHYIVRLLVVKETSAPQYAGRGDPGDGGRGGDGGDGGDGGPAVVDIVEEPQVCNVFVDSAKDLAALSVPPWVSVGEGRPNATWVREWPGGPVPVWRVEDADRPNAALSTNTTSVCKTEPSTGEIIEARAGFGLLMVWGIVMVFVACSYGSYSRTGG